METDMIMISQARYDELLTAEMKLIALEGAGVDNWQEYDDAMEMLEKMRNEEE